MMRRFYEFMQKVRQKSKFFYYLILWFMSFCFAFSLCLLVSQFLGLSQTEATLYSLIDSAVGSTVGILLCLTYYDDDDSEDKKHEASERDEDEVSAVWRFLHRESYI